jgi:hypothetical protein
MNKEQWEKNLLSLLKPRVFATIYVPKTVLGMEKAVCMPEAYTELKKCLFSGKQQNQQLSLTLPRAGDQE